MRRLNKGTLIGILGKDRSGEPSRDSALVENVAMAKFSLATTEIFKDMNGQSKSTT